jgi:membrane dipeptidase
VGFDSTACDQADGGSTARDFPNLTRGLVGRGYTDEQVTGILGENFLRVFEAVCG